MNLKEFVSETLIEIMDGVVIAEGKYKEKGGSINSPNLTFRTDQGQVFYDGVSGQPAQLVEFDVAVTTVDNAEGKTGIGIFVGQIGIGAQGKVDSSNTSYSRIKFSIPILLPITRD